ncbi:palmitoyltransferase ZDHHC16 [Exaiptasia diaphana]|uniref:Palmitoyltransferase n=1 Tax=Exaiptasia diaphana TaxID=2652724 RepID=A0A913Y069_EXADI|nr:palmitoyltransferase ZDHHC16 [Exaiptasia diaphana]KXJ23491.1 putative palmitoyltransferase ZDHHC16 [Exaiptasia diaphana]
MMFKRIFTLFRVGLFTLRSLAFNKTNSKAVILDAAFKPILWIVDYFVGVLGPIFVVLVIGLIASVVIIYYASILPMILEDHICWIIFHIILSHWLLINICFHYFKSVFTSPGYSPKLEELSLKVKEQDYVICRQCSQSKPERTHHCSICKRCVLKMDHHCPWINNCVGHFNHRYFILFCIYMCLGSVYVALSSWRMFVEHFFDDKETESKPIKPTEDVSFQKKFAMFLGRYENVEDFDHNSIIFVFMLCSAVAIALGLLSGWHILLILKGETSIELHINKKNRIEYRKLGKVYKNPYDYGPWQNWKKLLGIVNNRSWMSILLPSSHHPYGDGISWKPPSKTVTYRSRQLLPV